MQPLAPEKETTEPSSLSVVHMPSLCAVNINCSVAASVKRYVSCLLSSPRALPASLSPTPLFYHQWVSCSSSYVSSFDFNVKNKLQICHSWENFLNPLRCCFGARPQNLAQTNSYKTFSTGWTFFHQHYLFIFHSLLPFCPPPTHHRWQILVCSLYLENFFLHCTYKWYRTYLSLSDLFPLA